MTERSFDKAALNYDATFTNTNIGKAQREAVWRQIDSNKFPIKSSILELNCGTGEDAQRWQTRQMNILSTDSSSEMIRVSKSKFPELSFHQLNIKNCKEELKNKDIVFSNFGGFNCLNKSDIQNFFMDSNQKMARNSSIVLIIMGKKCIWDNLFLLAKGKFSQVGRRNTNHSTPVVVDEVTIETWYYSPKEIQKMAGSNFKMMKLRPIGLFVPPSYLSKWFENKNWLIRLLKFCDRFLATRFFANCADHYYIQFIKRN